MKIVGELKGWWLKFCKHLEGACQAIILTYVRCNLGESLGSHTFTRPTLALGIEFPTL